MHKKILNEWKKVGIKYFWGDFLDSRFYVCHLISKKKLDVILDIGCGAGVILNFANSKLKIGLDADLPSLRAAKLRYNNFDLIQADVRFLPLKDAFFHDVLASHIISPLESSMDRKKVCDEISRIMKKDGQVIIIGSNRQSKFFSSTHTKEQRFSYLHYSEIFEYMKKKFDMDVVGYGPYSKIIMGLIKRIIYWLPEKISEYIGIEKLIFRLLKSKTFLKNGRSYIMICKKTCERV